MKEWEVSDGQVLKGVESTNCKSIEKPQLYPQMNAYQKVNMTSIS